jgi:outer membrane biosynthesis protein TonB
VSEEGQVPPEAEAEVAKKQASVSEEGQVPPEAESKEGEKQASVSEEGQVPPEAESKEAEKQASVSEEGQVPPEAEAEVNQPESEKTNQDTTVTNVIVEGISRFLRDSEGTDLLRGQSSDSSYNFSNVQDESWNEDSDDDQDDDQGIDNEKKIEAAGKSIYTNVLFQL